MRIEITSKNSMGIFTHCFKSNGYQIHSQQYGSNFITPLSGLCSICGRKQKMYGIIALYTYWFISVHPISNY